MNLWRPDEHEALTDSAWDAEIARRALAEIVADAERAQTDGLWPGHPLDDVREDEHFASLYLGSAGMIWALARLGSSLDSRGRRRRRPRAIPARAPISARRRMRRAS